MGTSGSRSELAAWKPAYPGEHPSLGWGLLQWATDHLPSPLDEDAPFRFTDEQARHLVEMYRLDTRGRRLYRRAHEEQAKGWGKGPFAAVIALMEFGGPVCFDGWDASGQPVGVPWGTKGRPAPWVQVAAVSEAQTANTWNALYGLLRARRGQVADGLGIDSGRTLLRRKDMPSAFMERVTASAGTREGQPIVFAVLDEPQLWTESNAGVDLARTILRNLTKTGGWGLFTGNAPLIGAGSVAEVYGKPTPGALHLANRPSGVLEPTWERKRMRVALDEVYGDAYWVPRERLLDDIADPAQPWADSLRFFFNVPGEGSVEDAWMPLQDWDDRAGDPVFQPALPVYACVRVAHDNRSAAVAVAQRQGDHVALRARVFTAPADDYVSSDAIEDHIRSLHRRYPARVLTEVQYRDGGKAYKRKRPGPEILHHGAFFEPSRQRLAKDGVVMIDWPSSAERLAPAAAALMQQVISGELVHDGSDELTIQVGRVVARERPRGWAIESGTGETIVAAQAAMLAVYRAVQQAADRRPR